jgi:Tol biopolymer transport system component
MLLFAAGACGGNGGTTPAATGSSQTPAQITTIQASPSAAAAATEGETGPSGGKIAFVTFRDGDQEVYIMNADGSDERNLTQSHTSDDFDPDLSADGKQLVFVSNRLGVPQAFAMNVDGSGLHQVTTHAAQAPHWSRDGKQIVYSLGGSVAVVNADGTGDKVVLQVDDASSAEPCRAGAFPGGWSPDDSQITYYSASINLQDGQVCTINADGSNIKVIVADPGAFDVEPVWSPDGKDIVYRAITDGVMDIWTVNLETGEGTNVTHDPELDVEPDWSPDGQRIVFASLKSGKPNFDIYVISRDGGEETRLTDADAKDAYPGWAP